MNLNLDSCCLTSSDTEEIKKTLTEFSALQEFNASKNLFPNCNLEDIMQGFLNCTTSLMEVNFSDCCLKISDTEKFSKLLLNFSKLKEINIKNNSCKNVDLCEIIVGIRNSNTTLKYLNFSNCLYISKVKRLKSALPHFSIIKEINLKNNSLKNSDFCEFAQGLLNCKTTLRKLDLGKCDFFLSNSQKLKETLLEFTALEELFINYNSFMNCDFLDIIQGLLNCKTKLRKLYLSNSNLNLFNSKR